MKYLAVISGLIVIFAVSLMLSGCSQKGQNFSENQPQTEQVSQNQNTDKGTELKLIAIPATPSNKSAGVKETTKVNYKKPEVKKEEEKKPEVKTEDTKTKDPRLADDSAMDPKNKFPENYNGK